MSLGLICFSLCQPQGSPAGSGQASAKELCPPAGGAELACQGCKEAVKTPGEEEIRGCLLCLRFDRRKGRPGRLPGQELF